MNPSNIECVVAFEIRTMRVGLLLLVVCLAQTTCIGHTGGLSPCLNQGVRCSAVQVAGNPGSYVRSYEVSEAIHALLHRGLTCHT